MCQTSRLSAARIALAWTTLVLGACAHQPNDPRAPRARPHEARPAETPPPEALRLAPLERLAPGDAAIAFRAAAAATSMLGTPYRYGGHTPAGFDCSGLVYYSYRQAGVTIPRTSRELFRASTPVAAKAARPGDLVFFRLADKVSHVGIYLDDGRFVHAPSTGKQVEIASLRTGYYERNLIRLGRLGLP